MVITGSSTQLAVASLLSLSVALLSAPSPIQIRSISCSVIQCLLISYLDGRKFQPTSKRCATRPVPPTSPASAPVQEVSTRQKSHTGAQELISLVSGDSYRLEWLVRLPNAAILRPTTFDGTDSRIRVRHKLSIEIRYRKEGDEEDILLSVQRTVRIASASSRVCDVGVGILTLRFALAVLL